MLQVDDGATRTENVTGLDKYTEYEFQVLAFTSGGDGPKSSVKVERTDGELIQYIKITLLSLPRYPVEPRYTCMTNLLAGALHYYSTTVQSVKLLYLILFVVENRNQT